MTRVFISYSYGRDREFVAALKETIDESDDIELLDPTTFSEHGEEIASAIRSQIATCDVFLPIIGLDRPNILLETGMALGAGKDLLLVASSLESLPFNLRSLPIVLLSGDPKADSSTVLHRILELRPPQANSEATPVDGVLDELHTYTRDPQSFERIGPQRFEELVANIFAQQGYELTATGRTHDAGYDIALRSPRDNQLILVQVKKLSRQSRVSIAQVRELFGAASVMNADIGVLVTSTSFTTGAKALAAEVRRPKLTLVTMDRLLGSSNVQDLWEKMSDDSPEPGTPSEDG